jgi:hypothetical protein
VYYARILNNNNDREYVRQAWLVQRANERIERDERSPSRQGLDSACLPQLSQAGRGGAQAHSNTPCGEHPKPHARGATQLLLCSPVFLVIIWLYLHLIYVISAFSFSLVYHDFNNRLQLTAHNYISISHISLLSTSYHPYFRLNYFKIHVMDNKFKKIN